MFENQCQSFSVCFVILVLIFNDVLCCCKYFIVCKLLHSSHAILQSKYRLTYCLTVQIDLEQNSHNLNYFRYAVYSDMLQFCCLSECVDDDMINSVFQLWIAFEKGYTIDPQKSRVDVSGNNAVFCLRKTKTNQTWHHIRAGFDKDNLDVSINRAISLFRWRFESRRLLAGNYKFI